MTYKSFDEQAFRAALAKKDYDSKEFIKTCVISSIRNNPRFAIQQGESKSEAGYIIEELRASFKEIFEPYCVQPDEEEFDETQADTWNKEYFIRQTVLFGRNFSIQRYNNLIKIGQKITPFEEPQEIQTQAARKPLPVKKILIATATVALVALVALIVVKTLQ